MFGSASAQHATYSATSATAYAQGGPIGAFDVAPDDRIGAPVKRRRLRVFLNRLVILAGLGGGGYGLYEYQAIWMPWVAELTRERTPVVTAKSAADAQSALSPLVQPPNAPDASGDAGNSSKLAASDPAAPGLAKPGEASSASSLSAAGGASRATAASPVVEPLKPQEAKTAGAAAAPTAAEAVTASAASPAPTGNVPRASVPYQAPSESSGGSGPAAAPNLKRAESAGLHPDLSAVVLGRLSSVDFQNAGVAINKAMADTADDDVLVWPKQRKAGEAQFRVHFVAGAEQGCRRYVVTIAKDGWLTTALPMEKCGVRRKEARAQKSPVSVSANP